MRPVMLACERSSAQPNNEKDASQTRILLKSPSQAGRASISIQGQRIDQATKQRGRTSMGTPSGGHHREDVLQEGFHTFRRSAWGL
jgi:hypothetical protein